MNEAEEEARLEIVKKGLIPMKRGYPDFWAWDAESNQLVFVEVKESRFTPLKEHQAAFMLAVQRMGARCYRFSPEEGFRQI